MMDASLKWQKAERWCLHLIPRAQRDPTAPWRSFPLQDLPTWRKNFFPQGDGHLWDAWGTLPAGPYELTRGKSRIKQFRAAQISDIVHSLAVKTCTEGAWPRHDKDSPFHEVDSELSTSGCFRGSLLAAFGGLVAWFRGEADMTCRIP